MPGAKAIGDAALGSKGTLFIPYPGSGCWAGSGPPGGLQVTGSRVCTLELP